MVEARGGESIGLHSSIISGFVFALELPFWQVAGLALRISCATPVLGTLLGSAAVAVTSVQAAMVAYAVTAYPHLQLRDVGSWLKREEIFLHAGVGLLAFKVLGGKFRNVMPSDVRYPGALAKIAITARGSLYASDVQKSVIKDLFRQFGCHHCGRKTGTSISDHMPPNLIVHGPRGSVAKRLQKRDDEAAQRFYPQCRSCIKLQSTALRHGSPPLVLHWKRGWPEPFFYAGFFLGLAQLRDSSPFSYFSKEKLLAIVSSMRTFTSLQKVGPTRLHSIQEEIDAIRIRDKQIREEIDRVVLKTSKFQLGSRVHADADIVVTELRAELERNAKLKGRLKDDMRLLGEELRTR